MPPRSRSHTHQTNKKRKEITDGDLLEVSERRARGATSASASAPAKNTATAVGLTTQDIREMSAEQLRPLLLEMKTRNERIFEAAKRRKIEAEDATKALAEMNERIETLTRELDCPIFVKPCVMPVSLPCQHTYEFEAIEDWYKQCVERKQEFKCPLCKQTCAVQPDDLPISLLHMSMRRAIFGNEKLDMSVVKKPKGARSYDRSVLAKFPRLSAVSAAESDLVGGDSKDHKESTIVSLIAEKKRIYEDRCTLSQAWAIRTHKTQVLPRLRESLDKYDASNSKIECSLTIPKVRELTEMKCDSLRACVLKLPNIHSCTVKSQSDLSIAIHIVIKLC